MPQNLFKKSAYVQVKWLGVVRQQAMTWANVDPDLYHRMSSQGYNKLNKNPLIDFRIRFVTESGANDDKFVTVNMYIKHFHPS